MFSFTKNFVKSYIIIIQCSHEKKSWNWFFYMHMHIHISFLYFLLKLREIKARSSSLFLVLQKFRENAECFESNFPYVTFILFCTKKIRVNAMDVSPIFSVIFLRYLLRCTSYSPTLLILVNYVDIYAWYFIHRIQLEPHFK